MCYKSEGHLKKTKRCTISRTPFVVVLNYSSSVVSAALLAIAGTAFFLLYIIWSGTKALQKSEIQKIFLYFAKNYLKRSIAQVSSAQLYCVIYSP